MQNGKYTLFELVSAILEKMESDEVNSIFDTVESTSVAGEIRDTFRNMVANREEYKRDSFTVLENVADYDHFNQLRIPDNVVNIKQIWKTGCDSAGDYYRRELTYLNPRDFVERCYKLPSGCGAVTVAQIGVENGPCFPVLVDREPEFYTTFDDKHLFFDAVDRTETDTLKSGDIAARATLYPEFKMEDNFVPPLAVEDFPYLLNDAMDACFINFKGVSNSKAQKRARDQQVWGQNNRDRVGPHTNGTAGPPYGRYSRGGQIRDISRNRD